MGIDLGTPFVANQPAEAEDVNDKFDVVAAALDTQAPGEIIVADSDSIPRAVELSGDATINGDGELALADGVVGSDHLNLTRLSKAASTDENIGSASSWVPITGTSQAVAEGVWSFRAYFNFWNEDDGASTAVTYQGRIELDGVAQGGEARWAGNLDDDDENTCPTESFVTVPSGGGTIRLAGRCLSLAGTRRVRQSHTRLMGLRLSN